MFKENRIVLIVEENRGWCSDESETKITHVKYTSPSCLAKFCSGPPLYVFGANPNLFGAFFRLSPPAAAL
jgi:hypothetical protein